MRKFITIMAGALALALAGTACSADAPTGGNTAPAATSAPADGATAAAELSQADEAHAAAVKADFPYELSSQDGDVDAAGEAVCGILRGKTLDYGDPDDAEVAMKAYEVILDAVEDEGKDGLTIRKDGTDDSITIYGILGDVYCPDAA